MKTQQMVLSVTKVRFWKKSQMETFSIKFLFVQANNFTDKSHFVKSL